MTTVQTFRALVASVATIASRLDKYKPVHR